MIIMWFVKNIFSKTPHLQPLPYISLSNTPILPQTCNKRQKNNHQINIFLHKPSGSPLIQKKNSLSIMDIRKVTCAVLIAAASMSAALATTEVSAPAPGPSSGASAATVGSLVGASVLSFFALFH